MAARFFSTVVDLDTHGAGPTFAARGPRMMVDLDPFLNVDLFEMRGPVFAPHPHAGFSAVTYMFEDSTTSFQNRDSLGDRSLIEPGGLRWTVAGSGIVHDEVVAEVGRWGHGAQIFVRHPSAGEVAEPYGQTLARRELPIVELDHGSRLRVVAGEAQGARSPVVDPARPQVYDLVLGAQDRTELVLDGLWRGFVMTVSGAARLATSIGTARIGPVGLAVFEPGDGTIEVVADEPGAHLLVGAGVPLHQPAHMAGGFCLSTEERLVEAIERYRSGAMDGLLVAPDA